VGGWLGGGRRGMSSGNELIAFDMLLNFFDLISNHIPHTESADLRGDARIRNWISLRL
jgi:hypothetical protein